jgi:hypothetical protein
MARPIAPDGSRARGRPPRYSASGAHERVACSTGARTTLVTTRPCRAPPQTISAVGLIGGAQIIHAYGDARSPSVRVIRVKTLPAYRYHFGVRCGELFRYIVATTAMCDAAERGRYLPWVHRGSSWQPRRAL